MSEDDGRLVSGKPRRDERENIALRPKVLRELIGQDSVREQLKIIIEAAKGRKEPVDHILFYGPPGLGKTSLAYVIANEMEANIHITAGPSIERSGDLAAILTHMKIGDVLFIDEIHRLGRAVEEVLYPAMEDFALDIVIGKGPAAKNMRLNLPRFTVIGATTQLALLAGPLRDRFGARFRLDYYEQKAMEEIIARAANMLKIEIKQEGLSEIARRSRGTPRVGLRLLRRTRDYAQTRAQGIITGPVAGESLELMGIDYLGLDDIDRRVLSTIILNYEGGPVGLPTIAASISEDSSTIEDVYEPYLMQLGFLKRTPRGRVATARAYEHMGYPFSGNGSGGDQNPLFLRAESIMDYQSLGKILLAVGIVVVVIGGLLILFGRTFDGFPGTLRIEGQGFSCVVPILASILLSIVLTVILNIVVRLINRP